MKSLLFLFCFQDFLNIIIPILIKNVWIYNLKYTHAAKNSNNPNYAKSYKIVQRLSPQTPHVVIVQSP